MNLHLTWDGLTGPNILYRVQYKLSGSDDPYTAVIADLHNNFYTISDLPDGFYDVQVVNQCSLYEVVATFRNAGKPACSVPVFMSYTVLADTPTEQTIRVDFTNSNIQIKARTTRVTDNTLIREEVVNSLGTYSITIPKNINNVETYKIEISNICAVGQSDFVDMGEYSVQRATNASVISKSSTCNCADSNLLNLKFVKSSNPTVIYTNPVSLPWDTYEITAAIPKGSCTGNLTLQLLASSGNTVMKNQSVEVNSTGSNYTFLFSNLDLKTGPIQGSYIDSTTFKITC